MAKKIFLVKRTTPVDYDEYDSCVILADNIEEAHDIIENNARCVKTNFYYSDYGKHDRKITEIDLDTTNSNILCSSFNAG